MNVQEEVVTMSSTDVPGDNVVREHCYVNIHTKRIYYHLTDHNYFRKKKPEKPASRKRKLKITELRAVYNCKNCGYRTLNRELFTNHDCGQKPKFLPCKQCEKNIAPAGYERCSECTYFTKTKSSLKVHMRIHAKGTPYKCTECTFSAKDLKDLIVHYEETKDLKCDCGFITHVKHQMVTHRRSHSGEKPFSCGVCGFASADRSALQRHLKKH